MGHAERILKMKSKNPILLFALMVLFNAPTSWGETADSPEAVRHKISGDQYLREGKLSLAVADYNKAVSLNPHSTATYFNLAIALYAEKDVAGAASALQNILEIDPSDVEALYNLACLKLYLKHIQEAKNYFQKAKSCCQHDSHFRPLIEQGLGYLNELTAMDSSTQDLALFLLQMQQGLAPLSVIF